MEVMKGYKQTEVGVIPFDWDAKSLYSLSKMKSGETITSERISDAGIYPCYGGNGLRGYTNKFTHSGEYALIGRQGALCGNVQFVSGKIFASEHAVVVTPNTETNIKWLYYMLGRMNLNRYSESSAQPGLSVSKISILPIPVPYSYDEQTAIATALSDADALISRLEKLIAKKHNIKQGTMQQLLQPKECWDLVPMPKVCWFQEGPGVRNNQFTDSGVKLLNGTNIENGKLLLEKTDRYISEKEAYGWYAHFLIDAGDILIACSGVTIDRFDEKVTIVAEEHLPLCMNTSTMRFKVTSPKLNKYFLFHFLHSKNFKEQIGGKATGSAQLNFGPSHIKMVYIPLPEIEEQNRVATILSDMDIELAALEAKLEKYRQIKQGMMQNLLTGKIRLV